MIFLKHFVAGLSGMFAIMTPPLYRYPYRNSHEALGGDWQRVGRDVDHVLERQEHE